MTVGRILRIEKLSTFDGDGLRTVIFLKGCPLGCRWCSTPESQKKTTDFGIHKNKCTNCFTCVDTCPEGAISHDDAGDIFTTDMTLCKDCRQCVDGCPAGARIAYGYNATVDEMLRELGKDSVFYYHSGGGVTVSGGEPLVQKDFVAALLEGCVMQGINTAVETSGHVPWENIENVLPWIDTLFYDLKHLDANIHRQITGVDNGLILENLKKIDETHRSFPVIVRMPVIPTLNDQDANIKALGLFCRGLKKLKEIQLLPYHRLGIETYRRLSLSYGLEGIRSPGDDEMNRKVDLLKDMGLRVRVGG
ncbi:pyruvate formate lyase activating enzyme [Desulfocicer vacuolatum DSM 3385]|uniref:Pyruvate formate lyase activating enzyme n=1 Tax=Desulfocicer vacuolatum DSM 3385 TaxID=1121400 RepID=A0A1W2AU22_9BACT|nr:glycyl-radical enzyme activating protein [Desulfocicer vacuolatum]SMC63931.1 pyruvate formate lyase activating enzyme [Desulfocicer vacuolatum DSM 3385]